SSPWFTLCLQLQGFSSGWAVTLLKCVVCLKVFVVLALCVFEGKNYSLGDSWMDNACLQCTCLHPVGVGCCETVHRPVDFPAWCQVQVEPVSCRVSLVQTVDPRLPCFPGDSMQDPSHGSPRLQQQLQG
uniref:Prostate-associated microseminoprotein n=1 Tax=Takifugu rubripes TaxID=31033 RepID=A0A3B5K2X9_TAKRU